MASPPPSRTVDEQRIEQDLRSFLGRLIQAIDRWSVFLGLSMIFFIPLGIILASNYLLRWSFWQTVGYGSLLWLGLVVIMVVLSLADESKKIRAAAAEFLRRYPGGSPEGEAALRILREMESPSKTERKLLNVILGGTPDAPPTENFIIRRRPGTPEGEIAEALGDLSGGDVPPAILRAPNPPPAPPVEPFTRAEAPGPPRSSPGGGNAADHFDFIPLEPFTPPEPPPGKGKA
ncbi:MAG: hypothetical protein KA419_15120 [Acidobacteria bacterium]|nr:hypothetical protein [Acidobacteriota bacterium]